MAHVDAADGRYTLVTEIQSVSPGDTDASETKPV
jgi:hypothetical protein